MSFDQVLYYIGDDFNSDELEFLQRYYAQNKVRGRMPLMKTRKSLQLTVPKSHWIRYIGFTTTHLEGQRHGRFGTVRPSARSSKCRPSGRSANRVKVMTLVQRISLVRGDNVLRFL